MVEIVQYGPCMKFSKITEEMKSEYVKQFL